MKKNYFLCMPLSLLILLLFASCGEDQVGESNQPITEVEVTLEELNPENPPTETTWVVTDNDLTNSGDFDTLREALTTAAAAEQEVELVFSSLESMPDNSFTDCEELTSISLPETTTIGESAFEGCVALTTISVPVVEEVADNAFSGCEALEEISLPATKKIGSGAFASCGALTSLSLATDVKLVSIATDAFSATTSLTISRSYTSTSTTSITLSISSLNSDYIEGKTLTVGDFSAEFAEIIVIDEESTDDGVTATMTLAQISADALPVADTWVFTDETATSYNDFIALCSALDAAVDKGRTIKVEFSNLTEIPQFAFCDCNSLTSISAPKVESLGLQAFRSCSNLLYVNFPEVSVLDAAPFGTCLLLETILMPKLMSIAEDLFNSFPSLSTLEVNNEYLLLEGGVLYDKEKTRIITALNTQLSGDYVVPSTVVTIDSIAFNYCSLLESISFSNVTSLYGIRNCSSLISIFAPNVTTIDYDATAGCPNLTNLELATNVEFVSIHSYAFLNLITTNATLTTSSVNSKYVSGNTLTVGDFSAEFAEIILQ